MWHETEEEMVQLLKSLLRMNIDQTGMQRNDPDHYELEGDEQESSAVHFSAVEL